VTRHREGLERQSGNLEDLVSMELDVGGVRPNRLSRIEGLGILEHGSLALRHVHGRAGCLCKRGNPAQVIPVTVRDEDRGDVEAEVGTLVARIDDDRLGRGPVGAYDVAVRLCRPERVCVDDRRHPAASLTTA
jgi:hypothetical protein